MQSIRINCNPVCAAALALVCAQLNFSPAFAENAPAAHVASPEVYKLIAENDQMRVIAAAWKPGQEDAYHSHLKDRASIFLTDCQLRLSKPDGTYRDAKPKAGKAVVRADKPVKTHRAKNIGDQQCRIIIVELKK